MGIYELVTPVTPLGGVMNKSKRKSELFHKTRRCENLILHLEKQLASGRYSGDQQTAINWLCERKMALAILEHQLKLEA
jgi:hypothetical protein